MGFELLFHVTSEANAHSIYAYGIDPRFSQGKRAAIWLTERASLPWAVLHVSDRHKIPVSKLVIFRTVADTEEIRRTCKRGIYTCDTVIQGYAMLPALDFFEPKTIVVKSIKGKYNG